MGTDLTNASTSPSVSVSTLGTRMHRSRGLQPYFGDTLL